jgi:excisionase family DNA binding protein
MKTEGAPEKLLYGRRSAAAMLDLSPRAVDYAIRAGELEAIHIGKRVLIPRESLLAFAQRGHPRVRPVRQCDPRKGSR